MIVKYGNEALSIDISQKDVSFVKEDILNELRENIAIHSIQRILNSIFQ